MRGIYWYVLAKIRAVNDNKKMMQFLYCPKIQGNSKELNSLKNV